MEISEELLKKAETCVRNLRSEEKKITIVESCTGGLLSFLITSIPGASDVLVFSLVTYSNHSKHKLLGISLESLKAFGAVSRETATAMASCLLALEPGADLAISLTGLAGARTSTDDPSYHEANTGTVFIGCAKRNLNAVHHECKFDENLTRSEIQKKAAESALNIIIKQSWAK